MSLTAKQHAVLAALNGYIKAPTARQLADRMERPTARSARYSYDEVYSQLRRMEQTNERRPAALVSGDSRRPRHWTVTDAGRAALAAAAPAAVTYEHTPGSNSVAVTKKFTA